MPELPEVETLVLELRSQLEGAEISGVEIRNESILNTPRKWIERNARGKKIIHIGRRGKFIQLHLSENFSLWFHLGMTGQLLLEEPAPSLKSHTHFLLSFTRSDKRLIYRDVRRFGRIAFTPHEGVTTPRGVSRLGPEPQEWNSGEFVSLLKERRGRIKGLLLNQSVVAGLGNIYADESLYRAGIHPRRRANEISRKKLVRLHASMSEVLEEAIRQGGSSIDDYLHLDCGKGKFQRFHRVYGRAGEACSACGAQVRRIVLSGRGSSYCPQCQR